MKYNGAKTQSHKLPSHLFYIILQACLATASKGVQAKATQNAIMKKEVVIHQRSKAEMEESIRELKGAIVLMKSQLQKNLSHHLFPYLGRYRTK